MQQDCEAGDYDRSGPVHRAALANIYCCNIHCLILISLLPSRSPEFVIRLAFIASPAECTFE
jgi:hypothetical protein